MADVDVESVGPDAAEPVAGGPLLEGNPLLAARALLFGLTLLLAGNGLQGSLLGVRSEAEGFSLAVTGVVMAAYFAGFLAGSRYAEHLLVQVGHIRVFAGLASSASAAVLVHALFVHPVTWGAMRFVTGACFAGIYVVSESWLNDLATNRTRGRLLSMYMVATMGGMTVGQFLLDAADTDGFELFVLASILVSVSLVPVTISASSNPPLVVPEPLSLRALFGQAPTGVITSFLVGTSAGVLLGLGAVYAVSAGVPADRLAVFLAAPLLGSVLAQWPIGWISDRVPRRAVMWWVAVAAGTTALVLVWLPVGSWAAIVAMFVVGGTVFPLYSLSIAYAVDWLAPAQFAGASASLVRVNGVGAVIGPLLGGALMSLTGEVAFFWVLVGTHTLTAGYIGWRVLFRDPLPPERQRRFVPFPARASAVAAVMIGRRRPSPYAEAELVDH